MKAFFCVLCSLLLAIVQCEWKEHEEECVSELGFDKAEMQRLDKMNIVPEYNPDFNSFLECHWKKDGALDEHGDIIWGKLYRLMFADFENKFEEDSPIRGLLSLVAVIATGDGCKIPKGNIKGNTPGQTIAKVQNCIVKTLMVYAEADEQKLN